MIGEYGDGEEDDEEEDLPMDLGNFEPLVQWKWEITKTLHWRHNDHDGVSNQQPHGCLLNRLFGRRSKKT